MVIFLHTPNQSIKVDMPKRATPSGFVLGKYPASATQSPNKPFKPDCLRQPV
jgi:hypothetical protein